MLTCFSPLTSRLPFVSTSMTVTATLLNPLPHADDSSEDDIVVSGVQVKVQDTDGDSDTATLTVNIGNDVPEINDVPPASGEGAKQVFESGLDGKGSEAGTTKETTTGSFTYSSGDAPAVLTIKGETVTGTPGQQIVGQYGTLTINSVVGGVVSYSYTLTTNTGGDTTKDDFALSVKDADGDEDTATLTINIVDDVPDAKDD